MKIERFENGASQLRHWGQEQLKRLFWGVTLTVLAGNTSTYHE